MDVGYVDKAHLPYFAPFLLKDVIGQLEAEEPVTVLGLESHGMAIGALSGLWIDGAFQVSSLYVAPDYRRQGGGRKLMQTLTRTLKDFQEFATVEIAYTELESEQKTLTLFLESLGFVSQAESEPILAISLEQLGESSFFQSGSSPWAGYTTVEELPQALFRKIVRKFQVLDDHEMADQLLSLSLDKSISVVYEGKDGALGFVLLERISPKEICLAMAMATKPTVLVGVLRTAFDLARKRYPEGTILTVQGINENGRGLLKKLAPTAKNVSKWYVLPTHVEL